MWQGLGQGGGRNVMGVVGGVAGVRARRWEKCNGSSGGGAGVRARRWEKCNGSSGGWGRG